MIYCEYGCGREANHKQTNGKLCCSKFYSQCPELKKKNSQGNKGRIKSIEERKKLSKAHKGKVLSIKHKQKISQNHADFSGEKHPLFGKNHSKKTKEKIGLSNKGRIKNEKTRKKLSIASSGENNPMFGISRCGSENPNWKGGISRNPYCHVFLNEEFRNIIFQRDGGICLNPYCSHISKRIVIHHIDYNKVTALDS